MKKAAIITIMGNNYGCRLQNYAVNKYLTDMGLDVETIPNNYFTNIEKSSFKDGLKYVLSRIKHEVVLRDGAYRTNTSFFTTKRAKLFLDFNQNIKFRKKTFNFKDKLNYDYYIVGSDQVWNPYFGLQDLGLLTFENDDNKKISFSASFGVNELPENKKEIMDKYISKFKKISVREERGKEILEKLTGRKDIEVLIDPTMLLTSDEWDKVSKKPKQLKSNKYILNYFLGEVSEKRKKEIEEFAKKNDCDVINILDKNDSLYESGPSEFLYLEKNAFLICTDSFHSSVFAILYNKPFIIYDREDKLEKMNSRIDTLISKFKLDDRRYNGTNITKENLIHDYSEAYKILENERRKSLNFIMNSLK